MWQSADGNKVVSQKMKVLTYQKHRQSLKSMKPGIKIEQPWRPSFSLSKRQNKYHKLVESEISKQNQNLLGRMLKIEAEPMRSTLNLIPRTVPSNKLTFMELKARERKHENNTIQKENMKIIDKLQNVHSDYDTIALSQGWRDNLKYRDILVKKESVPDYNQLARQYQKVERSRISRPRTAFPSGTRQQDVSF